MSQMSPSRVAPHVEQGRCVVPLRPGVPDAVICPAQYLATSPAVARAVLSVTEAAELLGVSEWLVLQQVRRGLLPHRRVGRRIVISRERLLAWVNVGSDTDGDTDVYRATDVGAPSVRRR